MSEENPEKRKLWIPPMTGTQASFARFMFEHWRIFGAIGNLDDVFHSVKDFIKYSDNFDSKDLTS